MSLAFVIGITLAAFAESLFLGTILLYLAARWFKAPETTLARSAGLCAVLTVWLTGLGVLVVALGRNATSPYFALVALLAVFLGGVCVPWYTTKRVLRTGWWRALAVWVAAWVPVTLANLGLSTVTVLVFVECFSVPTGAMAPTVIGVHADRICQNCGCNFAVSLSDWVRRDGVLAPERSEIETDCPNCRQPHVVDVKATVLSGDWVVVDKTRPAGRWSVVAFRDPRKRQEIYVKRAVGLPGEMIELAAGDVFLNGKRLQKEPHVATDLWLAMHDTRVVPAEMQPSTPRWRPRDEKSGWHELQGTWTTTDGRGDDVLEFAGKVTDFLAYNGDSFGRDVQEHVLGDVLLTCDIGELRGSGGLEFEWSFGDSSVHAEVKSDGQVVIAAKTISPAGEIDRGRAMGRCEAPLAKGDSLSFAIRDGQAYVMHQGHLAALAVFGPDDVELVRDLAALEAGCRIAISADNCSVALNRITVHRDVYYVRADEGSNQFQAGTGTPLQLADNEYFMLGDNSARALDSRFFRGVPATDCIGVVRWIYWPKGRWHELK